MPNEMLAHLTLSREEAKRRSAGNIRILDGLRDNDRLMIQGPPGSGKSSYAMALAKRKYEAGFSNSLYLCWNELLAAYNDFKFKEAGLQGITVWPYFHFVRHLKSLAGQDPEGLTYADVNTPGGLSRHLTEALDILKDTDKLPKYDYIIVDECQDLFHRGIEHVLDRLSQSKEGVRNGHHGVFYDNTQVFFIEQDRQLYEQAQELLKNGAASYQIDYRYRGVAGAGLYEFIADLESGDVRLDRTYGSDLIVRKYDSTEQMWELMQKTFNEIRNQAGYEDRQMVLLFTSNLSSGIQNRGKLLDDELDKNDEFVRITKDTLTARLPGKIKFTTALTYKGLERDIVVLVVKDLYNEKIDCIHQVLIGASRARIRLYLLIDSESMNRNMEQAEASGI
jgi:hypothetical protein